jgi:hypothetical protein
MIAVVKEDLDTQVKDFRDGYWSEEVFLDSDMEFFKALGGGEVRQPFTSKFQLIKTILNPWTQNRARSNFKRAGEKGIENVLGGDGLIFGGVYVVRPDGKASYVFVEEQFGDHAPVEDVIEAVKAAKRGETYDIAPRAFPLAEPEEDESSRKTWKEWSGRLTGPDSYVIGDVTRGIAKSTAGIVRRCTSTSK